MCDSFAASYKLALDRGMIGLLRASALENEFTLVVNQLRIGEKYFPEETVDAVLIEPSLEASGEVTFLTTVGPLGAAVIIWVGGKNQAATQPVVIETKVDLPSARSVLTI